MAELGTVFVGVEGDWSGFQRQAQETAKSLGSRLFGGREMIASLNDLGGSIVSTVGGAVKKVTLGVVGIGTALGALAVKGGLNRALTTDKARVQLQRMGYDLKEIDGLVKTVSDTFDGTVFSTPEGFALVQKLLGVGIAAEDVGKELGTIADLAAHADVELSRLGEIYVKTAAAGKLTAHELNQISIAGISLEPIANAMGKTSAELREMSAAGELTHEVFWEAAGAAEMYAGAAKAAGDTVSGAFSNVRSNFARLGEAFLSPLFGEGGPLVTFFHALRSAIRALIPVAGDIGERFGNWLIPALERLANMGDWIGGVIRGWRRDFDYLSESGFVLRSEAELTGMELRRQFDGIIDRIRSVIEWYREHQDAIQKVIDALTPAAGGIAGVAVSVNLLSRAFGLLKNATPIGLLLTLVTTIVYAWQNSEKFRDIVTSVFEKVKAVVVPIIETVIGWVQNFGDQSDATSSWLREVWDQIKRIFEKALEAIQVAIERLIEWGRWAWEAFGDYILTTIRNVWELIKGVFRAALDVIEGILDVFIGVFTLDWERAWEGVKKIFEGVWEAIFAAAKFIVEQIANVFTNFIKGVVNIGGNIVSGIWDGIKSMGSWLKDKIMSWAAKVIPGPIASILGIRSPSRLMMEYGRNIGEGLAEGILDSQTDVMEASERLAATVAAAGSDSMSLALAGAEAAQVMPIVNHFYGPVGGSMADFAAEIERQRALESRFNG